jgi:phosphomannomutase
MGDDRMNKVIFREYDIRGDVDQDLTDPVVRDIGTGICCLHGREGQEDCIDCEGLPVEFGALQESHY